MAWIHCGKVIINLFESKYKFWLGCVCWSGVWKEWFDKVQSNQCSYAIKDWGTLDLWNIIRYKPIGLWHAHISPNTIPQNLGGTKLLHNQNETVKVFIFQSNKFINPWLNVHVKFTGFVPGHGDRLILECNQEPVQWHWMSLMLHLQKTKILSHPIVFSVSLHCLVIELNISEGCTLWNRCSGMCSVLWFPAMIYSTSTLCDVWLEITTAFF